MHVHISAYFIIIITIIAPYVWRLIWLGNVKGGKINPMCESYRTGSRIIFEWMSNAKTQKHTKRYIDKIMLCSQNMLLFRRIVFYILDKESIWIFKDKNVDILQSRVHCLRSWNFYRIVCQTVIFCSWLFVEAIWSVVTSYN